MKGKERKILENNLIWGTICIWCAQYLCIYSAIF